MILKPHDILIRISETDRDKLFNKRLRSPDGTFLAELTVDLQNEIGSDRAFAQDVNIAEVIEVGSEVKAIGVGNFVVIDYLVDTTPNYTAWEEWAGKYCVLDTRTQYYTETLKTVANRRTKVETFIYKEGEMESYSMVIAIVKGNTVIPNAPYIFLEHKEDIDEMQTASGLTFFQKEKEAVKRKVAFGYLGCTLEVGTTVLAEGDFIFQRRVGEIVFDVCFESDIIGIIK